MKKVLLAAVAVLGATTANAATVVFDFDSLTAGTFVGAYNGAVFTDWVVSNGFGPSSPPNFAYNDAPVASFDYAAGFTSLSFTAGVFTNSTVQVFSGLGGTGTLLGSSLITDPPGSPNAFAPFSVAFSGTGKSVVVTSGGAQFGWDDITLGAVPEPESWAMMIAGFGLVGAVARRRRAVVAA